MTDEGFELSAGEDGWAAYFQDMFDRVTRGKLDELKKEYQGIDRSLPLSNMINRLPEMQAPRRR
jgi:hypothetical protein